MPSVTWQDGSTTRTSHYHRSDAGAASSTAPIVVLLHGASGNLYHFRDPGHSPGFSLNLTWRPPSRASFGWYAAPPTPIMLARDPLASVEGIEPFLVRNGYRTVNYSQVDPDGLLRRPVLEFDAIYRDVRQAFPQAPIHIICHSRGGLLIRRWLATTRSQDPASLSAIRSVQTLNSPHRGSALGDIMKAVDAVGGFFEVGPFGMDAFLANYRSTSVMMELAVSGNAFLTRLEADERALASAGPLHDGITFHTFAGTAPRLVRLHWYYPEPLAHIPQWNWPPFHWLGRSANLRYDVPDVFANSLPFEARPGMGDILVAVSSCVPRTWSPAATWSFPVNHASVLWDGSVKARLLANLGGSRPTSTAVGAVSVSLPEMVPNRAAAATVTVMNKGVHGWTDGVSVRRSEPLAGSPWVTRVTNLAPGASRSLSDQLIAPSAPGSYPVSWVLEHDEAGELSRVTQSLTVMTPTCAALSAQIQAHEEELLELHASMNDASSKPAVIRSTLKLSRDIANLKVAAARQGC